MPHIEAFHAKPQRNQPRNCCEHHLKQDGPGGKNVKRVLSALFFSIIALWLTGCAVTDEQRAQNTAKAFVDAMQREDRLAVKETVTAKAWANLSSQTETKREKQDKSDISVGQAVITDDTAQVPVTDRENGKETVVHVKLRREENAWRVYAMAVPTGFGNTEMVRDFEHPESMIGESFKVFGEALGEGMGAMLKGFQEGLQKSMPPTAPPGSPAPQ
jgi:hypothetical protein